MGHVAPASRARRHRRLTGLSGVLLFACMFMPSVNGCHQPVTPYEVPPSLPPYLYGLVLAFVATVGGARALQVGFIALRVLGAVVIVMSALLIAIAPAIGLAALIVGTLLAVPSGGSTEARIAVNGVEAAVVSILWFGFWAVFGDALIGVYLALGSSFGLLFGCVAWVRELDGRPAVEVPQAVAAARR